MTAASWELLYVPGSVAKPTYLLPLALILEWRPVPTGILLVVVLEVVVRDVVVTLVEVGVRLEVVELVVVVREVVVGWPVADKHWA